MILGLLGAVVPCHHPASQERSVEHIASQEKGQKWKFEVLFVLNACCFHIIVKSKNHSHLSHTMVSWGPYLYSQDDIPKKSKMLVKEQYMQRDKRETRRKYGLNPLYKYWIRSRG